MPYQGKFEGTAARKLNNVVNFTPAKKEMAKKQMIVYKRKRLLKAAAKALGKRILMGIGLLLAYASLFGMMLGLMLIMIKPDIWGYLIAGFSLGYSFLVVNCRAFEYIGDKMGPKL